MNILTCVNKKYAYYLSVMLRSLSDNNKGEKLTVYVFHSELDEKDEEKIRADNLNPELSFQFIKIDGSMLVGAPTVKKYPKEIYYRIFASEYLPKTVEKILYLDVDIIVKGGLKELYETSFDGNMIVAATHIKDLLNWFNRVRLSAKKGVYLNSGVMLMNVALMRKVIVNQEIYDFIERKKHVMTLFDQDVLFGLYGDRIKTVNEHIYNLSERSIVLNNYRRPNHKIDLDWVEKNAVILHYIGANKPWNSDYRGILRKYYDRYKF